METGKRKRGPGRPFPKGKSGNPKGRPRKGDSVAEKVAALTRDGDDILAWWVKCMKSDAFSGAERNSAASKLAERIWGGIKPPHGTEVEVEDGPRRVVVRMNFGPTVRASEDEE